MKPRLADPFIGSYIVSFFIFNWPLLIFLFSNLDADQKVARIKAVLDWRAFTEPFVATAMLLLLFPKLMTRAYSVFEKNRVEILNIRQRSQEFLIRNSERSAVLQEALNRELLRVNDAQQALSRKDQQIGEITGRLVEAQKASQLLQDERANLDKYVENLLRENEVLKDPGKRLEQSRAPDVIQRTLEFADIDKRLSVSVREYMEAQNLTPDVAVAAYANAVEIIFNKVVEAVPQSTKARQAKTSFDQVFRRGDYSALTLAISSLNEVRTLKPNERELLNAAQRLVESIQTFLS